MQPLVSIITVTKNCAATIERTLESIKAIKTDDIQYIIINGESEDETLSIISRYKQIVDVLISEKDTGIYNAMNKGTAIANGQYILFLNGDDYILAEGFNEAKKILVEKKPEILSCHSEVVSQNGTKLGNLYPSLWRLFFFNTIPHLSTFVSSTLQKKYKFREQFKIAADYDMFLRVFLKMHYFQITELVVATHFRGGYSNNSSQSIAEMRQIRRENLGAFLYSVTRIMEYMNQYLNLIIFKFKRK